MQRQQDNSCSLAKTQPWLTQRHPKGPRRRRALPCRIMKLAKRLWQATVHCHRFRLSKAVNTTMSTLEVVDYWSPRVLIAAERYLERFVQWP
jgi:hypothetical protein